jgi:hypothetical protein
METVVEPPDPPDPPGLLSPPLLELPPPQLIDRRSRQTATKKDKAEENRRDIEGLRTEMANDGVDEQQLWRVALRSARLQGKHNFSLNFCRGDD